MTTAAGMIQLSNINYQLSIINSPFGGLPFLVPDVGILHAGGAGAAATVTDAGAAAATNVSHTLAEHLHLLKLHRQHRGLNICRFHYT